jgi:hypothetical protein
MKSQKLNLIRHHHDGSQSTNVTSLKQMADRKEIRLKSKSIVYWTSTIILSFALLSGGAAQLARQRQTVDGIVQLGYPVYFVTLLGFWKVLGAIAFLAPRFPRLKEWAYAGAFFDMTSAAVSFAATHSSAWHVAVTLLFAVLVIVSWATRPPGRVIGILFPAKASSEPA